ncbi:MAG: SseB family protein [Candidatus Omnitrophica bacterium]|nr:SseB family protein [Candidatus Omnitrophota bacterium]
MKAREDAGRLSFVELVQGAKRHENLFHGLCRMLLDNNLILALNETPQKGNPALSIRVLPTLNSDDKGIVLIFSSRETLARAGQKDQWQKNKEDFYDYVIIKGQTLFKALRADGYKRMLLDVGSPVSFPFDEYDLTSLAEGKIPPFRDHRQTI